MQLNMLIKMHKSKYLEQQSNCLAFVHRVEQCRAGAPRKVLHECPHDGLLLVAEFYLTRGVVDVASRRASQFVGRIEIHHLAQLLAEVGG